MDKYIFQHEPVHRDQLRALLQDAGFKVDASTFRDAPVPDGGRYSDFYINVGGPVARVAADREYKDLPLTGLRLLTGDTVFLSQAVAEGVMSSFTIEKSGQEPARVRCCLYGVQTDWRTVGRYLYGRYLKSAVSGAYVAGALFNDDIIAHRRAVTVRTDIGSRWTDGDRVLYTGAPSASGRHCYLDMEAFDSRQGICYISPDSYRQYMEDVNSGHLDTAPSLGETRQSVMHDVRTAGLRDAERVARELLQKAASDGTGVRYQLDRLLASCGRDRLLSLDDELADRHALFVEERGERPNFAHLDIYYKGSRKVDSVVVALTHEGACADGIVAAVDGIDGLRRLAGGGNKHFTVTNLQYFDYGDRAFIEKARAQLEFRTVEVDLALTPQEVGRILQAEGIRLPAASDFDGRTLPLEKGRGTVRGVFLLVRNGTVYDWETEWHDRGSDVERYGPAKVESLRRMAQHHGLSVGDAVAQSVHEGPSAGRVSDVRVYRNSPSGTAYYLRCKIDGRQMMGRELTGEQVLQLANGGDRSRMAASVFADALGSAVRTRSSGRGV